MIHEVKGNLLESSCQFICHQVNCQGKMGSGIARSIREKWPKVYKNYIAKFNSLPEHIDGNVFLGNIQIVPLYDEYYSVKEHKYVINLFAQDEYGYDGKRYTSYDAFWMCLGNISQTVPKGSSIGFPKNIGCCRGGANWNVIKIMIEETLGRDYEVYIFEYNGG